MVDMVDEAQQLADDNRDDTLAAHRLRHGPTTPNPGICVVCGDLIAPKRLAAYPTARRCLNCQKQYERTPK